MIYQAEDFQDCVPIRKSKKMNHLSLLTDKIFLANKKARMSAIIKQNFHFIQIIHTYLFFCQQKSIYRTGIKKGLPWHRPMVWFVWPSASITELEIEAIHYLVDSLRRDSSTHHICAFDWRWVASSCSQ